MVERRDGNIIGGGDWGDYRLVTSLITSFSKENSALIRNPNAIRPWQYVLDALNGYMVLAMKNYLDPEAYSSSWNFGPPGGSVRTVSDFSRQFSVAWGNGKIKIKKTIGKHEDQLLLLNSSKAREKLNWKSLISFNKMISLTAKWYKHYYNNGDMLKFSRKSIADYIS